MPESSSGWTNTHHIGHLVAFVKPKPETRTDRKGGEYNVALCDYVLCLTCTKAVADVAISGKWLVPRLTSAPQEIAAGVLFTEETSEGFNPTIKLADLTPETLAELADELTRTRDGQVVVGRAVQAEEAARWTEAQYRSAALETFRALAPLYRLR